jgi:hypothetical protein
MLGSTSCEAGAWELERFRNEFTPPLCFVASTLIAGCATAERRQRAHSNMSLVARIFSRSPACTRRAHLSGRRAWCACQHSDENRAHRFNQGNRRRPVRSGEGASHDLISAMSGAWRRPDPQPPDPEFGTSQRKDASQGTRLAGCQQRFADLHVNVTRTDYFTRSVLARRAPRFPQRFKTPCKACRALKGASRCLSEQQSRFWP